MNKLIKKRVLKEAQYIIDTKSTIRQTAHIFGISKSTVHKDINTNLRKISNYLFNKVSEVFKEHQEIKHLLGGIKTKEKYLKKGV